MTIHGKDTGIAVAQYDVTRWCNEVSSDMSADTAESTAFDAPQSAKEYVQGHTDATFSWSGREQNTLAGVRQAIGGLADVESSAPFTVALERGFHTGRRAIMGGVLVTKLALSAPVADVVSVSGDLQSDGPTRTGRVLTTKEPYTATTTGPTINLGAAGVEAWLNYHVVKNSRNGQVTVTVQDSVDGSVWVDYHQIVVAAGVVTGQRFHFTDAIGQYVRIVVALAGTTGEAIIRTALARKGA